VILIVCKETDHEGGSSFTKEKGSYFKWTDMKALQQETK
jgi:hypothetical protein